eukprot:gnl/MRDRNA2_/MRDRNA2_19549_c0_seq1.p1 gnl/MRDRNA2_/MRDRNA2_19549_c0~~gnl/MRDRNA2_/MRDRNA2_19549_c0_seq1.p1  ORF type:complete len:474 (+),score=89.81 gnl/MRDRNA2_/MRDRNA2_19549_c0_seq1:99-1520(+)
MTSTPESWDDVGCLRLQVGCTSQVVEDLQFNFSQFQKLSEEQILEQQKAIRQIKLLLATTTGVCACVLVVLVMLCCTPHITLLTTFSESAPVLTSWLSDTARKMHRHEFKALEPITTPTMQRNNDTLWNLRNLRTIQQLKQTPINDAVLKHLQAAEELLQEHHHLEIENRGERAEKILSSLARLGEIHVAAKEVPSTSWKGIENNQSEPKQTTKLQGSSGQNIQSVARDEEHIQRVMKSFAEDSEEVREGTEGSKETHVDEGDGRDKVEAFGEHPVQKPGGNNLGAALSEGSAEGNQHAVIKATPSSSADHEMSTLPPLPFQLMSSFVPNEEVEQRSSHGLFWVCFPPSSLELNIKRYAQVFNEVAQSKEWRMYPFVYLDTRVLKRYGDHQCNDVNQITFVMEKKSNSVSDSKRSPTELSPDVWTFNSNWYNPVWFKRVFRPDQVIQPSLVKKFLDDVHSGKLPQIRSAKGDL